MPFDSAFNGQRTTSDVWAHRQGAGELGQVALLELASQPKLRLPGTPPVLALAGKPARRDVPAERPPQPDGLQRHGRERQDEFGYFDPVLGQEPGIDAHTLADPMPVEFVSPGS